LVRRARDPMDRRNVFVVRTNRGSAHLTEFAKRITRAARSLEG
jgi:DNA-binding MarR family transcriptional regulator